MLFLLVRYSSRLDEVSRQAGYIELDEGYEGDDIRMPSIDAPLPTAQ